MKRERLVRLRSESQLRKGMTIVVKGATCHPVHRFKLVRYCHDKAVTNYGDRMPGWLVDREVDGHWRVDLRNFAAAKPPSGVYRVLQPRTRKKGTR